MSKLQPGKGGHFHLNADTLEFFTNVFTLLNDELGEDLNERLDNDEETEIFKELKAKGSWEFQKDKFGQKLYREFPWQDGAYRITVVLNNRGELKLDVREWFDPEA